MRLLGRTLLIAVLFVVGVAIVTPTILRAWGRWLVVEDPLQHAQAIVVLGGQVPFRAIEAATLYKDGWAPEVWITRGGVFLEDLTLEDLGIRRLREHDVNRRVLERLGVPPAAIRLLPGRGLNTAAELWSVAQATGTAGSKPVLIVVTSKAHTRRVSTIGHRLIGDRVSLVVRAASRDPFNAERWWRRTGDAIAVVRESFGMVNIWFQLPIEPTQGLREPARGQKEAIND